MTALVLAAALCAGPFVQTLDRAAVQLSRLERLQTAARRMDVAEAAIQAAKTPGERRAAWAAWNQARAELRTAAR